MDPRMKTAVIRGRRPFWLPASNYYVLAFAIAVAAFFLVWGILQDGGDDMPWATAGVSASLVLIGSVILREFIIRRANRIVKLQQRQFITNPHSQQNESRNPEKLTLERNAAILSDIQKKSDAANVLNRLSAGHREVFELCSEYISRNENELKVIAPGSPRLAALLKGRSAVNDFHRYHLLKWAQIEVHTLTGEARDQDDPEERKRSAKAALGIIETALRSYPAEESLLESQEVLRELIVSINVSDLLERAERAVFDGDHASARGLYRDALFHLGRDNIRSEARERAAERIAAELEAIRDAENEL
jgi:hypothetical protein